MGSSATKYTHSIYSLDNMSRFTCIYISGQMSGIPDLGYSKLSSAESFLKGLGFVSILNPYKMVDQTKSPKWHECLKIDIKDIMNYGVGGVILIDNWMNSKGATLEVILFLSLGIPIFDMVGENITVKTLQSMSPEFLHIMFTKMVDTHRLN